MMQLEDFLTEQKVDFKRVGEHHHARNGWIQLNCPNCGSGNYHLGINKHYLYANCWKCGRQDLIDVLYELTGTSRITLRRLIERDIPVRSPEKPKGKLILPPGVGDLLGMHKEYLRGRGFSIRYLKKFWQVKGIGPTFGLLTWRVFIPFYHKGEIVSWTTRAIHERNKPRYVSASVTQESVSHKEVLYGEDYCRHTIIVHEGPFDAWRTGPGAVATCGTSYTELQVARMLRYPTRVVCFDNESRAQQRAEVLCNTLKSFSGQTYNVQLDSKDAASASDKEIARLRKFLE
jgi:hypothetical protein